MKQKQASKSHDQTPSGAPTPNAMEENGQSAIDFAPAADEVARRAYFSYVNHGSLPGHDVQHWLVAEAELVAERQMTRTHAFHVPHEKQHVPVPKEEGLDL